MPIQACTLDGKSGYQWGGSGKCYTYTDDASRKEAKRRAILQGVAIGGGTLDTEAEKQLTTGDVHVPTAIGNTLASRRKLPYTTKAEFRIVKSDTVQRKIWGVVFEPKRIDTQGDFLQAPEIEKAAHDFMAGYRAKTTHLWLGHERPLNDDEACLTENYVTASDSKIGGQDVPAGSWVQGWQLNEPLWENVQKGELGGLSFGGSGLREDMAEEDVPKAVKRASADPIPLRAIPIDLQITVQGKSRERPQPMVGFDFVRRPELEYKAGVNKRKATGFTAMGTLNEWQDLAGGMLESW